MDWKLCDHIHTSLSVWHTCRPTVCVLCRITAIVISRCHWNLALWLVLPVVRTDTLLVVIRSQTLFYLPHHCGIADFTTFISNSHTIIGTTLGKVTDADKLINPQHFGSDPVDIRIRMRINPEIQIRITYHFWLRLDALAEVCALGVQSRLSFVHISSRERERRYLRTRSSAVADRPRDASCYWIFCQVTQAHSKWHCWLV